MSIKPVPPSSQQLIPAYDSPIKLPETVSQPVQPPVKTPETREETTMASTAYAINEIASTAMEKVTDKVLEPAPLTEKAQEVYSKEPIVAGEPVVAGEPLSETQKKLNLDSFATEAGPSGEPVVAGEAILSESQKKPLVTEGTVDAPKPGSSFKAIEGGVKGLAMAAATNPIDVASNKFYMNGDKPKGLRGYVKLVGESPFKGVGPKMTGNALSWGLMTILPGKIQSRTDKFIAHKKASETASILTATILENGIMMPLSVHLGLYQASKQKMGQEKTFFQSILDVNKAAYKEGGLPVAFKANYRGYLGTTLRSGLFFAPYVLTTEALKEHFKDSIEDGDKLSNKLIGAVFCSGVASVGATMVSCPANVLTMRMRASLMEQNRDKPKESYFNAVKNIYKESGWRGYTKGMGWGIVRIIPTGIALGLITAGADYAQERSRNYQPVKTTSIHSKDDSFPWGAA